MLLLGEDSERVFRPPCIAYAGLLCYSTAENRVVYVKNVNACAAGVWHSR